MRCYFNRQPINGPWGGGNVLVKTLDRRLVSQGHVVTTDPSIEPDVIICFDPRRGSQPNLLGYEDLKHAYPDVPIVQRVGDLGTHGKPQLWEMVLMSVPRSDAVIFPSAWAMTRVKEALPDVDQKDWHVISNAPDKKFIKRPRCVTHHWSTNPKKGFDFYERLCLEDDIDFTFIGRVPNDVHLTKHVGPIDATRLSSLLPRFDVYITASVDEAGANHVCEAMACGLPIIYHQDGGSIPEYVGKRGIPFDGTIRSFRDALDTLFPRTSADDVADQYVRIISAAAQRKEAG